MGVFGGVLGRSWVGQEAVILELLFKGFNMTADVAILNSLGDILDLGPSWGHLGAVLGSFWGFLKPF